MSVSKSKKSLDGKGTTSEFSVAVLDTTIGDPGIAFTLQLGRINSNSSILFKGSIIVVATLTYTDVTIKDHKRKEKNYSYSASITINHDKSQENRGIILTEIPIVLAFGDPYYREGDYFDVTIEVTFETDNPDDTIMFSGKIEDLVSKRGVFSYDVKEKEQLKPGGILSIDDDIKVSTSSEKFHQFMLDEVHGLVVYPSSQDGITWQVNNQEEFLKEFKNCFLYMNPNGYLQLIDPADGLAKGNFRAKDGPHPGGHLTLNEKGEPIIICKKGEEHVLEKDKVKKEDL